MRIASTIILLILSAQTLADTNQLAFLQYTNGYWQAHVMNTKDGTVKKITSSEYDKATVSWIGKGDRIFVSGIQSQAEIVNIQTGKTESIAMPFDSINDAVISPDGKRILFSYIPKDSVNNKLWLYDLQKKKNIPLQQKLAGRQYDPKWGSDSKTYYFVSGVANESYGIEKASIGSEKHTSVVKNSRYNFDADVSASGKLAYSSNRTGNYDLYTDDGKVRTRITDFSGLDAHPTWSQDETTIYYESFREGVTNIWAVSSNNNGKISQPKQITFSEDGARYPVAYKGSKP